MRADTLALFQNGFNLSTVATELDHVGVKLRNVIN